MSGGASVPRSEQGSVDINGKERNSNQAHNWEIKRPIVVESRRGPLPAQLFPVVLSAAVFCIRGQKKRILSLLTVESMAARSDLREQSSGLRGTLSTQDSAKTDTLNRIS